MRSKTALILPTQTALLYGYAQDEIEAESVERVWWIMARDSETGYLVWKIRAGSGRMFNDDF